MKKFILLILSIGVIYSCSEEFTEISPVGSLNDASLSNATGVNLLLTGAYSDPENAGFIASNQGGALTSAAMASVIPWFPYILSLAVFLFAFSTMITWSYYGQQAWAFVFGRGRQADLAYKLIFCLCIILGSAMSLDKVIGFSDAMIFAMCFPNLIGLYFLMPEARRELAIYLSEIRKGRLAAPK